MPHIRHARDLKRIAADCRIVEHLFNVFVVQQKPQNSAVFVYVFLVIVYLLKTDPGIYPLSVNKLMRLGNRDLASLAIFYKPQSVENQMYLLHDV